MPITTLKSVHPLETLRHDITNAYRMNETECLDRLIARATLPEKSLSHIQDVATQLVVATREYKKRQSKLDCLLHQYDLSTEEGIALMCLAEALLRIPDKATMDKFISDKLSTASWKNHISNDNSMFLNAAAWSLLLTGKIYSPTLDNERNLWRSLLHATSRMGVAVIRPVILQMMKAIGKQFVMGQTIDAALKRAEDLENMGYRFSYDMLGEAARTKKDAQTYFNHYKTAIDAIGQAAKSPYPAENPGISIKLSALYPRYEYTQHDLALEKVTPKLLDLAQQAKRYNIGLTVDAEETDRLDLSLDIFEKVFSDPSLAGWDGFGLAVQAYQKRADFVLDWLMALSQKEQKRIMVRLVKGAYWDAEIKLSQVQGFNDYPVFTRKNGTDVSYIACAKKMLEHPHCFYPQFGTHNAYSVAAIMEMANDNTEYEFQCLHGMGRQLYDQVIDKNGFHQKCRIYAPVGTHQDLLGYLVRRLLENGANSSFVNQLADDSTPVEKIVIDPVARMAKFKSKSHPKIPLPENIYGQRKNSLGIDLSDHFIRDEFETEMAAADKISWRVGSIINGKTVLNGEKRPVYSPTETSRQLADVVRATESDIEAALKTAKAAEKTWGKTTPEERAEILERVADTFQAELPGCIQLLAREAGKTLLDAIAEAREAVDFCRYYAERARKDLQPIPLPGPTGEENTLCLYPRGVMGCISPWNFPMAIFTGQIVAALAAGNPVVAKPAEQSPIIAFKLVQLMHQAGVPKDALQLLIGRGSTVGASIVKDERVTGIMFTGSTETAKFIEQSLANRKGPIALFIAETGGQNAMIVDSSALPEQTILDIVNSAFNSAGQRCSALRVLFVQEEMAPRLLEMLKGYMEELSIGDPYQLSTDIGPVIDQDAQKMLQNHYARMCQEATLLAQVQMNKDTPNGHFFAPCMFELDDINQLEGEVFGPILHVIRYKAKDLDKVMQSIIDTGYGLTLGVHSRIEATIKHVAENMPVGNIYVNRNMIGAVVGVQPFGGERLSGTGPKAGGPHYLPRLCMERTISVNTTAVGGNARLVSLLEEDE